jgi:opacity protein-like surface antigen
MKNLKTILTLIFTVFVFTSASFSQQGIGLGLEGGLNLANANIKPSFNTGSKSGFMVGGFVDIGVSKNVSIKPAIRYIMKGFEIRSNNGITFTENLGYIEFPMLVNVNFPLNHVKPYFEVGPTLGIQLSASEEATDGVNFQEKDVSTSFESVDFGLYFGSGMGFRVADKTELFTGFGYSLGFSNILKGTTTAKNSGFRITAGVKFSI